MKNKKETFNIQRFLVKILLSPFALLYGIGIAIRNFIYDRGLLRSVKFDIPIISVGNLSLGGAGKTPHIEYLIRLLQPYINVSTLSRGYKRKTKGYLEVNENSDANMVGDEPLQFKRKYEDVFVAVAEQRIFAIPKMLMSRPDLQIILLDDAFQHLAVKPGLNILLTEFHRPFTDDFLLPVGRLREGRSAADRADIIIVSKCPLEVSEAEKSEFIAKIKPKRHQQVYFSYYEYLQPYALLNPEDTIKLSDDLDVLLICAIARTDYLLAYLEDRTNSTKVIEYTDHHYFNNHDLGNLSKAFENMESNNKIILTTEKDAMRLELHREYIKTQKLPIYVLPVEVDFHFEDRQAFDAQVKQWLLDFS